MSPPSPTPSGPRRSILVSGPIARLEEYARAAEGAGWSALRHALVEVRSLAFELSALDAAPDWICVTSAQAVPSLEAARDAFGRVPCAAVGEASAARLRAAGWNVELVGAGTAADLARALAPRLSAESTVLWPRGSRSAELAERLAASGARIMDPVVYETVERDGAPPVADAVLFASPSAVKAWAARAPSGTRPIALAIGPTTRAAIERHAQRFASVHVLADTTPEALAAALDGLA